MSSSSSSSQKELEEELKDDGERLLMPPSSIVELLNLLDKIEFLLSKVEQAPSQSMRDALLPSMKALISNEILRHTNMNVKISVIACLNEIMRITAPDAPYDDEQMKEIFQLTVMAFEKLTHVSGRYYTKAMSILDCVAKVRSCLVMQDLECDELIVEMFKLFLNIIRSNHPNAVFSNMETIMTLVMEESEDISMDLLCLLLTSVKKDNQNASPFSWKLAENVIKNCAAKLKPYLQEAAQSMGTTLDDYTEVVTSIIEDESGAECLVTEALVQDAVSPGEIGPSGDGLSKSVMNDGSAQVRSGETLNDSNSLQTLEHCHNKQHEGTDARIEDQPENLCSTKGAKLEAEPEAVPKKRGRKPNSLIKPEEGYEHCWISGGRKSVELPHPKKKHGKKIGASSSKTPSSKTSSSKPHVSPLKTSHDESINDSPSQNHSLPEGSHPKRGRPKKKGSKVNQDGGLDSLSAQKGVLLTAQVEEKAMQSADVTLQKESEGKKDSKEKPERGSSEDAPVPKTNKESTPAFGNVDVKLQDGILNDLVGEQDSSIQQMDGKKRSRAKTTADKHFTEESGDEEMVSLSATKSLTKDERANTASNKHFTEESGDKEMVSLSMTKSLTKDESHMDEVSRTKFKGKRAPRKDQVSETPHGVKDYGDELVGCKIKVWWPMDQMFYEGAIHSFDPKKKKHKVLYTDGDEEILNLRKERWELLEQTIFPDLGPETDLPDPDALSDMPQEKKEKIVAESLIKQETADTSSKRPQKKKAKILAESLIKQETADTSSKSVGASASKSKVEAPKSGSKPTDGSTPDKDDASIPFDTLSDDGQQSTGKSKTRTPKIMKSKRDTSQVVTKSRGGSKPTDGSSLGKGDSKPFDKLNADGQESTGKSKIETPKIIMKSTRDASQIVTKSGGGSKPTDDSSVGKDDSKSFDTLNADGQKSTGKSKTETLKIIMKSKRDTSQIVTKSESAKADNESHASDTAKQKHVSTQEELSGDVVKGKLPDPVARHETETLKIVMKSKCNTSQIVTKTKGNSANTKNESHASDTAEQKHVLTQDELSGDVGKEKLPDPVGTHETETKSGKKRRRLVKSKAVDTNETETFKIVVKSKRDTSQIVTNFKGESANADNKSHASNTAEQKLVSSQEELSGDVGKEKLPDAVGTHETETKSGKKRHRLVKSKAVDTNETEIPKIIMKSKQDTSQIATKSKGESANADNKSHASDTAGQKHVLSQEELSGDVGKEKLPDPVGTHETETKSGKKQCRLVKSKAVDTNETDTLNIVMKSKHDTSQITTKSKGESANADNKSHASNTAEQKHVLSQEEPSGNVGKEKFLDPVGRETETKSGKKQCRLVKSKAVDTNETDTLNIVMKSKHDTSQIVTKSKGESANADNKSHASDTAEQKHVFTQEELSGDVGKEKLLDPVGTRETETKSGKKRCRLVKSKAVDTNETDTLNIVMKSKHDTSQITTKSKGESANADNKSHASDTAEQKHMFTPEEQSGDVGKEKLPDPVGTHETETKSGKKRRRLVKIGEICSRI